MVEGSPPMLPKEIEEVVAKIREADELAAKAIEKMVNKDRVDGVMELMKAKTFLCEAELALRGTCIGK